MSPANTVRPAPQDPFTVEVKIRLIQRGWTITDLARELGLKRNTVSLAVNRGLFTPTRRRIAKKLGIAAPL